MSKVHEITDEDADTLTKQRDILTLYVRVRQGQSAPTIINDDMLGDMYSQSDFEISPCDADWNC